MRRVRGTTGRMISGILSLAMVATGCGSERSATSDGTLTVFAASSLTAAFTDVGDAFSDLEPGIEVVFNFAGSSALATQIDEGAPADVVASADLATMTRLIDAGNVAGTSVVFATNRAQIIVAAGNPAGIADVFDLADPRLIVVSCAAVVPCGRYAEQIFDRAGVTVTPKSLEENVKAVVSKVSLGEADAGIVYMTDVLAAGDAVTGIDIPRDLDVVAEYPIAVTTDARDREAAEAFIDFVLSPAGQEILTRYGFGAP